MKQVIVFLIFVSVFLGGLGLVKTSQAATYYVDQNNSQSSDSNPGTEALPWKTITKANQTLITGDTVYIKAGSYASYIAPNNSGMPSSRITYQNYASDVVTIQNATYGIYLSGKSYVTVQGINFYNLYRFLWLINSAHHNTIAHCNFDQGSSAGAWSGSRVSQNSQYNWIHHCQFSKYGQYTNDDIGCVLDLGEEENAADLTRYNLIEDSVFFHGGHHVMGVYGKFNVIRSNYFHNEPWLLGTTASDRGAILYGDRNLSFSGYPENGGRNLFEKNRVAYASDPPDNIGATGVALNSSYNIVRFNAYYHNISAGLSMSLTSSYIQSILSNKVYNNTFFHNGFNPEDPTDHMSSGLGFGIYSGSMIIKDNEIKNNILYKHRVPFGEYNINTPDRKGIIAVQKFQNNWDGDSQGDPKFISASTVMGDPMNSQEPDLRLQSGSPCIDQGTFLTTIISPGGSGTNFQVADASYFMDGWGIPNVQADEIQLFGTTQKSRIVSVDYTTNTITTDRIVTWASNQGVSLAYGGAAPDIGAYEYSSSIFYGDVSENGSVTSYDASLAAQYGVGLIPLVPSQITKAEVSGNGTVSSFDASLIAQYAVGLIIKFPVEG